MLKVTHDEIPLSDEQAVDAILDALDVPYFSGKSPEPPSGSPEPPGWTRRLHHNYLFQKWSNGSDVWIATNKKTECLHRVVIAGLQDEKEANFLRSEFASRQAKFIDVEAIAREIVGGRDRRKYQNNFESALTDVRNFFRWQGGVVIESAGRYLPLRSFGFSTEDIELLRAIYERLPPAMFAPLEQYGDRLRINAESCPLCGNTAKAKRAPIKRYNDARKRIAEFNENYPAEVFNAWMRERLRPGSFTVATELYTDYLKWAAKHGTDRNERKSSKSTLLTLNKWGRLMVAGPYTPLRRNTGKGYRVTLRRAQCAGQAQASCERGLTGAQPATQHPVRQPGPT